MTSEAERLLEQLIDRVDAIEIDEFDFESWRNHIVTQRFKAEIELQFFEKQMQFRQFKPVSMEQVAIESIIDNMLKKFLSDLLSWEPRELADEENETFSMLGGNDGEH